MKKPNSGAAIVNIPNTPCGRDFLTLLRRHMNTSKYTMKCRGRGNPPYMNRGISQPLTHAHTIDIYIKPR